MDSGKGATAAIHLDVAMREYLAMRDEMNKNLAQNFTMVFAALAGAGAISAVVGLDLLADGVTERGYLLLLVGAFGLIVYVGSIGQLNAFKILERNVTRLAGEICERLDADESSPLLRFQADVDAFNRQASFRTPSGRAWFVSYGVVSAVAALTFILLVGIVVVGACLVIGSSGWPDPIGAVLTVIDVLLALLVLAIVGYSIRIQNSWDNLFPGSSAKS